MSNVWVLFFRHTLQLPSNFKLFHVILNQGRSSVFPYLRSMALAFSLVSFYVFHSLLADESVKSFLQKRWISVRWYRILYNGLAVVTLLPAFWFFIGSDKTWLFTPHIIVRGLAFLIIGFAVVLMVMALRQYDLSEFSGWSYLRNKTGLVNPGSLQTKGLNAWVRHPLYFASLLFWWACFGARVGWVFMRRRSSFFSRQPDKCACPFPK